MTPGSELVHLPGAEDWLALKDAVRRFENAWPEGSGRRIDDYLPTAAALRSRVLIELVHIDLELRLKAGEVARVEEYLQRYSELAENPTVALDLIAAEYEFRRRRESDLTVDEFLLRFSQNRAALLKRLGQRTVVATKTPCLRTDPHQEVLPTVDGYEVLSLLGRGGMGAVYKARQCSLGRFVALKFLPEACVGDPEWLARFHREARTASALNHPNICTIYDIGESAGRPFFSMELIEGQTIEALIGRPTSVVELARLLRQLALALAAAHGAGVIHRDIKPANVMLRADGVLKVLDFGLARRFPTSRAEPANSPENGTGLGHLIGTPLYMSPEQLRAEPLNIATDIFSLGVLVYELATGQHPFRADSAIDVMHAIIAHTPVPPANLNLELPSALVDLIQRMLAKDPRLRPTAVEVEAALTPPNNPIPTASPSQPARPRRPTLVGRRQELAALRAGFNEAAAGSGLMLCVTGEPGLGKTTLVADFLEEMAASGRTFYLARGSCSERLAGADAYLPILDALDNLLNRESNASVVQAMKLRAPTWYAQFANYSADDPSAVRMFAETKDASQERRRREFVMFLHEVSAQCPFVLFLDDIHWADPSSVDLLAYLGTRCTELCLLVVLTYRPSDLLRSQHPFGPVKLDLHRRGVCREITLPFLSQSDCDNYLRLAFAGHQFPKELAAILHSRTEGNPLFMVDLLRYLRGRGVIVQQHDRWSLVRTVPDLKRELPESVRSVIQQKVNQLRSADRHLLMAASVQGAEFDSTVVAQVLGQEVTEVEERLEVLERVHILVRRMREQTFPDRTLAVHYGFVHALYQNALYASLQPTRRARWSAAAARALLGHFGDKSSSIAAELALLFEAAREYESAANYYLLAAQNAARIFAHHEAVALARRGVSQLELLPDTPERARRELPLQVTLGIQLQVVQGYASAEAERTYQRARALSEQVQEDQPLFLVLWGLWMLYEVRSDLKNSRELAERLYALARRAQDQDRLLQAHMALGITSFSLGDLAATREHSAQGVALYDAARHRGHSDLYGQDPKVGCHSFAAVSLWLLGYPEQAQCHSHEAVVMGEELGHPTTRTLALYFAAMLRQYRGETSAVQECAQLTTVIATEHGLSLWLANSLVMGGWAHAEQGAYAKGISMLRQGLTDWAATGALTHRTYFLGLLADALSRSGKYEEGKSVLDEALALMQSTGTFFYGAELHRLYGELLLRQRTHDAAWREAEACFGRAFAVARQQQAKSFELRAAMSMARLYQRQGRAIDARPMLEECYNWFTEGFDTPDLQEAKALLQQSA